MLDTLVTSKTRLKLITKFFLNPQTKAFLRGLEESFGESSNSVRVELNRFETAGLLNAVMEGYRKVYTANTKHPYYPAIHNIICLHLGIDHIIDEVTRKIKHIEQIWLSGELAKGNDNNTIDLLLVGNDINKADLEKLPKKTGNNIESRSIQLTLYTPLAFTQMQTTINSTDIYLLWQSNQPTRHPEPSPRHPERSERSPKTTHKR